MKTGRRRAIAALGAAAAGTALHACRAATDGAGGACPGLGGQRIRWIVPNAPGGGYDSESRLLAGPLGRRLAAVIVIDNQPGAGGIVGARAVASAAADGSTLGLIGVPGLLVSALLGQQDVPNPATDFTILGRAGRSLQVWAAGTRARALPDILAGAARRPVVFAVSQAASPNVVAIACGASLLGMPVDLVAGFDGTRSACLAAVRGDVDLVCFNYHTVAGFIQAGELRAVLQISTRRIAADAVLDGVPVLGGASGEAAARAHAGGADPQRAIARAEALERIVGAGRLIVGPGAMPAERAACLADAIQTVLTSDLDDRAAARFDPAPAADAAEDVRRAAAEAPALLDVVRPVIDRLRG